MELKEFLLFLKKYLKQILLMGILFSLSGVLFFLKWPVTYVASGSFFVGKSMDTSSSEYFNYEGYYAQQSALSYANTYSALLKSIDVRNGALLKLNIPVTEKSLRNIERHLFVKTSPQLVALKVEGDSKTEVLAIWRVLAATSLEKVVDINSKGDNSLYITQLSEMPTVYTTFRNLYLNIVVGFLLGLLTAITYISFKSYMKDELK